MAKRLLIILLLMAVSSIGQMAAASPADSELAGTPDAHSAAVGYQSANPERIDASSARAAFSEIVTRDDDRQPQFVFPPDDRVRMSPADERVAWIITYYNDLADAFVCTATFIGPDTLLTAAHCVYDTETGFGFTEIVDVFPGIDDVGPGGSPYEGAALPHGWIEAWDWFVPNGWIDSGGDFLYDYAIITLNEDVGNDTGWLPVGVLSDQSLGSSEIWATTVGYPADKPDGTQWLASVPSLDYFDDVFIETQLDQFQGQSGSAVFRNADEAIFGIVSFEEASDLGEFNVSRRVNSDVAGFIDSVCTDTGCSYDLFFDDGSTPPTTPPDPIQDPPPGGDETAFDRVWARTDLPVIEGDVARTWMWGPQPFTEVIQESYVEAPNGLRSVVYYDKSRMEITAPDADPNSIWYVTNGLLVRELVSGRLQLGHETYEQHQPAQINVAGDADDPTGPTYATFGALQNAQPLPVGATITQRVDRAGNVTNDPALAAQGVTTTHFVPETNHTVAGPFWDFMRSEGLVYENGQLVTADLFVNPFYATGFPITEPYWAEVKILGTYRLTLIQVFERRVLTYTPGNPPGFLVEAGNVGQHYHRWRYELIPNEDAQPTPPAPDPDPTPEPPPPPDDGVPAEGEILGQADLTSWDPVTGPFGDTGAPSANGYVITNQPDSFLQQLADAEYGDVSFATRSRLLDSAPFGMACVIARAEVSPTSPQVNTHAYQLCSAYERPGGGPAMIDGVLAFYQNNANIIDLGDWELDQPVAASEWHELKIIARGSTLWFLFDGQLLGTAENGGIVSGNPGFAAWNFADLSLESDAAEMSTAERVMQAYAEGHHLQQAGDTSQTEFGELTVRELQ